MRAADLLPNDADVQLKAGALLLAAGRAEEAKARADKVLAVNPRHTAALVLRASALAGLSDFDGAIAQVQQAIALDPTAGSQTNLGLFQLAKGRREDAEIALRRAIATDPKWIPAQLAFGKFLWVTGRGAEAEEAFKAALALDGGNVEANRALATFYLGSNRAPEAEKYLRKVAEASDALAPRFALADYYVSVKRNADALAVLERLSAVPHGWAPADRGWPLSCIRTGARPTPTAPSTRSLQSSPTTPRPA